MKITKNTNNHHKIHCSRNNTRKSYIKSSVDDKDAIISELESVGFACYDNDGIYEVFLDCRFYAYYDIEDGVAYIEWNPYGTSFTIMEWYAETLDDVVKYTDKIYNWIEYDEIEELLTAAMKEIGATEIGSSTYAINNFAHMEDNVVAHLNTKRYVGLITWYDEPVGNISPDRMRELDENHKVDDKFYHGNLYDFFWDAEIIY